MKHIILCADDYGQNPAISQAIIELIQKKRLSATSCLVNSHDWLEQAAWLKPYIDQVDIGLHINFTHESPLSERFIQQYGGRHFSLPALLLRSHLHYLDSKIIEVEIHAQLDCFEAGLGKLPDFLDGHQHVHQFPVIRDAVLSVYAARLIEKKPYIRSIKGLSGNGIKRHILRWTGAKAFAKKLLSLDIPHNTSFSGVYDFGEGFAQKFPMFLEEIEEGGLIMCHPGLPKKIANQDDPIYLARTQEYAYFSDDDFLRECSARDIKITRFARKEFS